MISRLLAVAFASCLVCLLFSCSRQVVPLAGQQLQHNFMERATIHHQGSSAVVVANDPRPLMQAVDGVAREYGWAVNYEDPPYQSKYDLVDIVDPNWLAARPGMTRAKIPAGGSFQSIYPDSAGLSLGSGEEQVLEKIVSDYNVSGNPGEFKVLAQSDGSYSIVGCYVRDANGNPTAVNSILDTLISIPTAKEQMAQTLNAILAALAAKTGTKVGLFSGPLNLMAQTQVSVGGENVSARSLLSQMLHATGRPLEWQLFYDPDGAAYFLILNLADRKIHGGFSDTMAPR
jgi:hypothetical protein